MEENKKELLTNYLKVNVGPILVDFLEGKNIPNSVILSEDTNMEDLNGHYEGINFIPPKWYQELIKDNKKILVIDNLDSISKLEQTKFIEILKYHKVSTFDIPNDVRIIITAKEINKETINEEVYSLVVHIRG